MWGNLILLPAVLSVALGSYYSSYFRRLNRSRHVYPISYRDHVSYNLTAKGKELYYDVAHHPNCLAKNGACIPRGKCRGLYMLYVSQWCYKRDLVCCYDNKIKHPLVEVKTVKAVIQTATTEETTIAADNTAPLAEAPMTTEASRVTDVSEPIETPNTNDISETTIGSDGAANVSS